MKYDLRYAGLWYVEGMRMRRILRLRSVRFTPSVTRDVVHAVHCLPFVFDAFFGARGNYNHRLRNMSKSS